MVVVHDFLYDLICIIFPVGMFVYILVMSNEHILVSVLIVMCSSSLVICSVLLILYDFGNCTYRFMSFANCIPSGYAGKFLQFIIRLISIGVLCIFIMACNIGASGLVLYYLCLFYLFMLILLLNIINRI
jgi:hypothetical protein